MLICEDPPTVAHASYNSSIRWLNGTSVTYTCDAGYELAVGSSDNKTCDVVDADVKWSNQTVQCIPGNKVTILCL